VFGSSTHVRTGRPALDRKQFVVKDTFGAFVLRVTNRWRDKP
jgi:hypothetical protein